MPYKRQTLLFSATFSGEIRALANEFQTSPEAVQAAAPNSTADRVTQIVHPVDRERKREMLSHMIGKGNWQQVLVFTRTKHGANRLSKQLEQDGLRSAAIHGNKSQAARQRALADFKKGDVRVLVATDVAARGLDIDLLPHVVNFDLPNVPEDYIHRIGRTARAGQQGHAVSLVCIDEHTMLRDIERLLKQDIDKVVIEGYEPDPSIQAQPIKMGRSQGRPNNQRPAKKRASSSRGKPARSGRPSNNAGNGRTANPGKGAKRNSRSGQGAQATGRSANQSAGHSSGQNAGQNTGNSAGRNEARQSNEGNKPPSRSRSGNAGKAAGARPGQSRSGGNSSYGNNSNRGNSRSTHSGGRGRQQGAA
jgi:ATP-dependent RNA helicase RhlE